MNTRKNTATIVKFILDAIGHIGSILWLLTLLGLIPEPLFQGVNFMQVYFPIFVSLALLIFFVSALWLGYQIRAWHNGSSPYSTEKQIRAVDSRFRDLAFHFSHISDTPKGSHTPPNCVVYKTETAKEAYPIPEYLEQYLRAVETNWKAHDGESKLRQYLKTNEIHPNKEDPDYEDLGLELGWDGYLHLPDQDLNALLTKLDGRKINDVIIIRFYPWYRYSRSKPPYTPNRLLIKGKEAFWAPFHDLDLIHRQKIDFSNATKLPYRIWCWFNHYRYNPRHYTEDELLGV